MYDYYVYGHYTDNGDLFYVGKGIGDRVNQYSRNSVHDRVASMLGFNPKIILGGMTEREALFLENEVMRNAYERGIVLTNAQFYNLNDVPTEQDLFSFVESIIHRNMVSNQVEKKISINPIFGESLDLYDDYEELSHDLLLKSNARPYQMKHNIKSLNEKQASIILLFINYAYEINERSVKISFDLIKELIDIDVQENYEEITEYFDPQMLMVQNENYSVYSNIIDSFFVSKLDDEERYVWILFSEAKDTVDGMSSINCYKELLIDFFDSKKLLEIQTNFYEKDIAIELFQKNNFIK